MKKHKNQIHVFYVYKVLSSEIKSSSMPIHFICTKKFGSPEVQPFRDYHQIKYYFFAQADILDSTTFLWEWIKDPCIQHGTIRCCTNIKNYFRLGIYLLLFLHWIYLSFWKQRWTHLGIVTSYHFTVWHFITHAVSGFVRVHRHATRISHWRIVVVIVFGFQFFRFLFKLLTSFNNGRRCTNIYTFAKLIANM